MTITADNFFKADKIAANENAGPTIDKAHIIVAEEAAMRALKSQKLREARLAMNMLGAKSDQ